VHEFGWHTHSQNLISAVYLLLLITYISVTYSVQCTP